MLQHEYSSTGAPSCWWHLSRFQIELIYLHQKSTLLCLCAFPVPFSTGDNYQKEQKIPSLPVTSPWYLSRSHLTILNTWWLRQFSYKKRKHIFLTTLEMCLIFPVSKQPRSASLADRPEVPPGHLERHRSSSSLLCAHRKVNHSFAVTIGAMVQYYLSGEWPYVHTTYVAYGWASWNPSVAQTMLSLCIVIWKETGILQNFAVRIFI